jgi:two-component system, NarL family, response regulator DesR
MNIRVLIAEDQGMILGALAALLDMEADIDVVARAANGNDALRLTAESHPDVVITDIEMPGMTGLEFAEALKQQGSTARVIIVTTFARPGYLRRAMDVGVKGYLLKDSPAQQLAQAIRTVHKGGKVIAPELATEAWDMEDPLNERERQVLRLAGDGLASAEIARQLSLSEGTVRNYLSEAIGKLGAVNRVEAARIARQKGWL